MWSDIPIRIQIWRPLAVAGKLPAVLCKQFQEKGLSPASTSWQRLDRGAQCGMIDLSFLDALASGPETVTWHLDIRRAPTWIDPSSDDQRLAPYRPWIAIAIVADRSRVGLCRLRTPLNIDKDAMLVEALQSLASTTPTLQRPAMIVLGPEARGTALATALVENHFELVFSKPWAVDKVAEEMRDDFAQAEADPYLAVKGVDIPLLRELASAFAEFVRARPWLELDGDKAGDWHSKRLRILWVIALIDFDRQDRIDDDFFSSRDASDPALAWIRILWLFAMSRPEEAEAAVGAASELAPDLPIRLIQHLRQQPEEPEEWDIFVQTLSTAWQKVDAARTWLYSWANEEDSQEWECPD